MYQLTNGQVVAQRYATWQTGIGQHVGCIRRSVPVGVMRKHLVTLSMLCVDSRRSSRFPIARWQTIISTGVHMATESEL
jgi:hypothetical protein